MSVENVLPGMLDVNLSLRSNHSSPSPFSENSSTKEDKLRDVFDQFVGETFYAQMLSSMRKTVGKPAYFHGGRAEEVFQGQLDQILAQRMTEASAGQFTGSMFELFKLNSLNRS